MEITKELFERYVNINSDDDKVFEFSRELGIGCVADMEESFYIWAVNHGDKGLVMSFYQMNEQEYLEAQKLWADEA